MAFGFSGSVVARAKAVYEADTRGLMQGSRQSQSEVNRSAKAMDKDLRDLDSRWQKLGKSAGLSGKAIGVGLGIAGPLAAAGLFKAVNAASALEEQMNKTKVVFGSAAAGVVEFSKTTSSALGISQRAALEAAGNFGNMLNTMGFAQEEAAQMSTRLVTLAGDMASLNDVSPERMLEALRSGLAGEAEPLRVFGIQLTDAKIKAEALAQGLYSGKGALDANAKAAATYNIILKESAASHGDAANTANTLAGQQRRVKASLEELAASVGTALLPAITAAIGEFTEFLQTLQESGKASEIANGLMDGLSSTITSLEPPARAAAKALDHIAAAMGGWEEAFQLLLTGLLAKKVLDLSRALGGVKAPAPLVLQQTADGLVVVGDSADKARGKTGAGGRGVLGLTSALKTLSALGWITVGITVLQRRKEIDDAEDWKEALSDWGWVPGKGWIWGKKQKQPAVDPGVGDSAADKAGTSKAVGVTPKVGASDNHGKRLLPAFKGPGIETGAVDYPDVIGTPVRAPEDGEITRTGGKPGSGTPGGPGGLSLYYIGASGTAYFMTHMQWVAPPGQYSYGDLIGRIGPHASGPHVHVEQSKSPGALAIAQGGGGGGAGAGGRGAGGGGGAGAGGGGGTKDKIRYAAAEDVKEVASQVRFAYRRLSDIPADAAKKLRPGLAELTRILGKPVTAETLKEVERQAAMYMRQVGRILEVEKVAKRWKGQRAQLQRLLELDVFPPEREARIRKQVAAMDVAVAAARKAVVPTPAQLALIKRGYATLGRIVEEGLDLAREAVDAAKAKFEGAWGRFTDQALVAFDAQTARLLAGMRVRVRSVVDGVAEEWEFGQGLKTPSELLLEAEESARSRAAHEQTMVAARRRVEEATAAVAAAQAEGGEKLAEARAEQASAQAALDELLWEERRSMLSAAAGEERRIAEGRLTDAQAVEQARRDVLRGEFQAELVELGSQIVSRKLSYDQALGELQQLFGKYEVPFEEQGAALTTALSVGMAAAMGALETAIDGLVDAVDRLNASLSNRVTSFEQIYGRIKSLGGATDAEATRIANAAKGAGGLPGYAHGGEVSQRTLAWIGEAGREWVVPEGKIPPQLRPMLVPLLRRIIRGGSPSRGQGGILELAQGGEFPIPGGHGSGLFPGGRGGRRYNEAAAMQTDRFWQIEQTYGGNLYGGRAEAIRRGSASSMPGGGWHPDDIIRVLEHLRGDFNFNFLHQPADPWVYFDKARATVKTRRG